MNFNNVKVGYLLKEIFKKPTIKTLSIIVPLSERNTKACQKDICYIQTLLPTQQ